MTKIAELKDKGAVVAWSPIGGGTGGGEYADVIALGSKVRWIVFFENHTSPPSPILF